MSTKEIKSFNSGRMYSVNGQRIAWKSLDPSGRVAMVDLDRLIEYILDVDFDGPLDRDYLRMIPDRQNAHVMQAYDRHDGTMPDYQEMFEVRGELREAAARVPSAGGPKRLGS